MNIKAQLFLNAQKKNSDFFAISWSLQKIVSRENKKQSSKIKRQIHCKK